MFEISTEMFKISVEISQWFEWNVQDFDRLWDFDRNVQNFEPNVGDFYQSLRDLDWYVQVQPKSPRF